VDCYLVRHGEAVPETIDPRRPLTSLGREEVARVGDLIVGERAQVAVIYHSGILRAQQTAEILGEKLIPSGGILTMSGLQPMDDPDGALAELELISKPVMLVGHLPFMGRLAGLMISGDPDRANVDFAPATAVCCSRAARHWEIKWIVHAPMR